MEKWSTTPPQHQNYPKALPALPPHLCVFVPSCSPCLCPTAPLGSKCSKCDQYKAKILTLPELVQDEKGVESEIR